MGELHWFFPLSEAPEPAFFHFFDNPPQCFLGTWQYKQFGVTSVWAISVEAKIVGMQSIQAQSIGATLVGAMSILATSVRETLVGMTGMVRVASRGA